MTANELRIGNYVKAFIDIPCIVLSIGPDHIQYDSIDGDDCAETCDIEQCEPVLSSVASLLAIGFRYSNDVYYMGNLSFHPLIGGQWLWHGVHIHPEQLRYIHQVQNFIFATNGQELKFKSR